LHGRAHLFAFLFFILSVCGLSSPCLPAPDIPLEKIPKDLPAEVKNEIRGLYSHRSEERIRAAYRLGNMGDNAIAAVPFLAASLHDGIFLGPVSEAAATSVGEQAAAALVKIGKPSVLPLISALGDKRPAVQISAASALGELKDPRAQEPLYSLYREGDRNIKQIALMALVKVDRDKAVTLLLRELAGEDPGNREAAAGGLGWIRDPRAVIPLIENLGDKDEKAAKAVVWALGEITGKYFGRDQARWRTWWNAHKDNVVDNHLGR
jgi:HEAT repeat protein